MAISTNPNDGATVAQSTRTVTLSAGQAVLEAARAKAAQIGVPMNIAIVDEGHGRRSPLCRGLDTCELDRGARRVPAASPAPGTYGPRACARLT